MSHLYSFSFESNASWTRDYPRQPEILDYLVKVARKYKLYGRIRFNSAVQEARWDDKAHLWHTTIKEDSPEDADKTQTYTIRSPFLVSATGQLSIPKYPSLKGLETFRGKVMHSALWNWNYDLRGKRVGIIGTGSTAAQIIPEIAPDCQRLVIFQRTPTWVLPRHDKEISLLQRRAYQYIPYFQKRLRAAIMDFRESVAEALYDTQSTRHNFVTEQARQHLLDQLPGEANAGLRESLSPNYPFSCKRIVVSDDYYPALALPQVTLECDPISQVSEDGIIMANQARTYHELDLIIFATGFRTTEFMHPIKIFGKGGRSLADVWAKNGATAYLGITVEDLPNFGMLYGPNSNLAHNSLILQIEAQSKYINALIDPVLQARRRNQTLRLETKPHVIKSYNIDLQSRLATSTFADTSCTSWFKDEYGRITNNWCGSAIEYATRVSYINWSDFLVEGSGRYVIDGIPGGVTRWKRVVEETQYSDRLLVTVFIGFVAGLVVLGYSSAFF